MSEEVEALLRRIDAAIERVTSGRAHMRVPADPTDPDLVLADAGNWIQQAALAQHPAAADHPDDVAVDRFAAAMKEKLAAARAKGRGGWNNDEPGLQQRLSDMLRAHVEKGDPRDVANFAMFLHQRREAILPAAGYPKWIGFDGAEGQQPAAVDEVLAAVRSEVVRATSKFPTWPTDPLHASGVVQEEAGELAKAVLQAVYEPHKSKPADVEAEALQTAAMGVRFLMSMRRYDWQPGVQHDQPALAGRPGEIGKGCDA